MQRHDKAATMTLPPEHPISLLPCDLYSVEEMRVVGDFLKATLRCRGPEEYEKATKGWSSEARAEVAKTLGELRERGFYPNRIDENGAIVWGVLLKSPVRLQFERHGELFQRLGEEILRERGVSLDGILRRFS